MTRNRAVRRWIVLVAVAVLAAALVALPGPGRAAEPSVDCEGLGGLELPDVTTISAELVTDGEAGGRTGLPELCRVALTVEPQINVDVWLPTRTYNGRFQGVGNGGYAGRISYHTMASAVTDGYATASTDTGHPSSGADGSFAMNADGTLDWQGIEDFASRSLIQMTEKAQTVLEAFYGTGAVYSYWNSCSTGGRQGLTIAQRFPDAYDGILVGAPAINWDRWVPAGLWPQVAMRQELGGPIDQCKLAAATEAAVTKCDSLDGVEDGVLGDPRLCDFDPAALVGQETGCGKITAADARVIDAIWEGARTEDGGFLWYGLTHGTRLDGLAGPTPLPYPVGHHRFWVERDAAWDWRTMDNSEFEANFHESHRLFHDVIGTDDPDLSGLRDSGGKLLMWHGWNDSVIPPEGTIDYYHRVLDTMRNKRWVESFARLFMASGVDHCGAGVGATEFDMFAALVDWVENQAAPQRIIASGVTGDGEELTRPLCMYPYVARHDGTGDPSEASSFDCKPNFRGRGGATAASPVRNSAAQ